MHTETEHTNSASSTLSHDVIVLSASGLSSVLQKARPDDLTLSVVCYPSSREATSKLTLNKTPGKVMQSSVWKSMRIILQFSATFPITMQHIMTTLKMYTDQYCTRFQLGLVELEQCREQCNLILLIFCKRAQCISFYLKYNGHRWSMHTA